jgi:hypothetical protein
MLSRQYVQMLSLSITLGLVLQWTAPVMAVDTFAANWQARPLIDHSIKPQTTSQSVKPEAVQSAVTQTNQAALEAQLKPAEPFIASIEKNLLISPKQGALLTERLSELQTVLYGQPKYQDAGELLAEMAKLFPAEAAKAHAELTAKLQNSLPSPSVRNTRPVVPGSSSAPPAIQTQPATANASQTGFGTPSTTAAPQKQKKRFWKNPNDPFANDPFFQDQPTAYQSQQNGPSTLGAIGQGLAGLAMMAGSVAGSYYLNRNSGNAGLLPQNGFFNNPYANSGFPYGYVAPGYGLLPGQVPYYGYNQTLFGRPAHGGLISQPYQPYGNATLGISPLGIPTGFRPY